jgi:hypothetical protein
MRLPSHSPRHEFDLPDDACTKTDCRGRAFDGSPAASFASDNLERVERLVL